MNGFGGKILGEYPSDLTGDSSLNIGQGRFIPAMSWDAIINAVSEWTGITEQEDLDATMPNRLKFELFEREDIFKEDPPPPPTVPPTFPPKSVNVNSPEVGSLTKLLNVFLSSFLAQLLG